MQTDKHHTYGYRLPIPIVTVHDQLILFFQRALSVLCVYFASALCVPCRGGLSGLGLLSPCLVRMHCKTGKPRHRRHVKQRRITIGAHSKMHRLTGSPAHVQLAM